MMTRLFLLLVLLIAAISTASSASTGALPRGANPADAGRFRIAAETGNFECSGNTIPASLINDDYCDCADGSDEPGTSACSNGRFYCRNRLHRPETLPSSRVNDGVCDCCDGTDEWAAVQPCPRNCRELGQAARARATDRFAVVQRGMAAKAEASAKAASELAAKREELAKLKQTLTEQEAEEHRLEPEKDRAQAAETAKQQEINAKKAAENPAPSPAAPAPDQPHMDHMPTMKEAQDAIGIHTPQFEHTNGPGQPPMPPHHPPHDPEHPDVPTPEPPPAPEPPKPEEPVDPELAALKEEKHTEINHGDDEAEFDESRIGSIKRWVFGDRLRDIDPLWVRATKPFRMAYGMIHEAIMGEEYVEDVEIRDHIATKKATDELEEARSKTRNTRSEVEKIEKLLATDFGPDNCYYSIHHQCISLHKDEYNYELCHFDRASQSSTSLGNWEKWSDDKRTMHYNNGLRCWNGPDRTVKVEVSCGTETKLEDASEPARCEYAMKMTTPCACSQDELSSLAAVLKQYELDEKESS